MGGNIFKLASSIEKTNIDFTVDKFKEELCRIFPAIRWDFFFLGSSKIKEISGDIDLGIDREIFMKPYKESKTDLLKSIGVSSEAFDELLSVFRKRAKTASEDSLILRTIMQFISKKLNSDSESIEVAESKSGSFGIFTCFPQYDSNGKTSKYVQIDIIVGIKDWIKFTHYSSKLTGNLRGLHRTQLLLCTLCHFGFIFNHSNGIIKNDESRKVYATTPSEACELLKTLLKNSEITESDLYDYFKFLKILRFSASEHFLPILEIYFKVLDSTRCDIPDNLQHYWLLMQSKLNLTGKFLPVNSNLYEFATEHAN